MRPNSEPIRAQGLRIVVSKNLFSEELIKDFFYLFRPKNGGGGTAPLAPPPAGGPVFNLLRIFFIYFAQKMEGGHGPPGPTP